VNPEFKHIQSRIHAELGASVDESTYRLWFEPLRVESVSDGTLVLGAPESTCSWVRQRYGTVLARCARAVLGADLAVKVAVAGQTGRTQNGVVDSSQTYQQAATWQLRSAGAGQPAGSTSTELRPNPHLSFDRFVIGEANRLAHGAALTLAEAPGQSFNPLFICGPPGVGKTHLLHSIAGFLTAYSSATVVRLTASEQFTNEFLAALRTDRIDNFKAHFRRADVLLVDDIQFLQRKTRTEEEFFHTFNRLFELGSQIVVTSDRPPRDLQDLEDRLRERFEAGLVADIRPPDLATRIAILQKKVGDQGVRAVDRGVVELIARHVSSSVRALEGALVRIVAYASLTQRDVTETLASEVLAGLYPNQPLEQVRPTVAAIQSATCRHFEIAPQDMLSPSRAQHLVWPRQLAMFLARELTVESLPSIGRSFGGRDHTTVLYACRRAGARLADDPQAQRTTQTLRSILTSQPTGFPPANS
jgi:chromosomal replication initiator protein